MYPSMHMQLSSLELPHCGATRCAWGTKAQLCHKHPTGRRGVQTVPCFAVVDERTTSQLAKANSHEERPRHLPFLSLVMLDGQGSASCCVLSELFLEQVARRPHQTALKTLSEVWRDNNASISYRGLDFTHPCLCLLRQCCTAVGVS